MEVGNKGSGALGVVSVGIRNFATVPSNPGGNDGNGAVGAPIVPCIGMLFGLAQCNVGSTANMYGESMSFIHFTTVGIPLMASKLGPGELRTYPSFLPVMASLACPPYPQTGVKPKPVGAPFSSVVGKTCCIDSSIVIS